MYYWCKHRRTDRLSGDIITLSFTFSLLFFKQEFLEETKSLTLVALFENTLSVTVCNYSYLPWFHHLSLLLYLNSGSLYGTQWAYCIITWQDWKYVPFENTDCLQAFLRHTTYDIVAVKSSGGALLLLASFLHPCQRASLLRLRLVFH
jgi:hypothetical protein